jgi:hypothetical protein
MTPTKAGRRAGERLPGLVHEACELGTDRGELALSECGPAGGPGGSLSGSAMKIVTIRIVPATKMYGRAERHHRA